MDRPFALRPSFWRRMVPSRRRAVWIFAEVLMIGIILALTAATLLPVWLGPSDDSSEMPVRRPNRR